MLQGCLVTKKNICSKFQSDLIFLFMSQNSQMISQSYMLQRDYMLQSHINPDLGISHKA